MVRYGRRAGIGADQSAFVRVPPKAWRGLGAASATVVSALALLAPANAWAACAFPNNTSCTISGTYDNTGAIANGNWGGTGIVTIGSGGVFNNLTGATLRLAAHPSNHLEIVERYFASDALLFVALRSNWQCIERGLLHDLAWAGHGYRRGSINSTDCAADGMAPPWRRRVDSDGCLCRGAAGANERLGSNLHVAECYVLHC